MTRDYYEVLGVSRDADAQSIKKAYRRLARELHPDVNSHDPDCESKFKEATQAYEVLCDADKRRLYDTYGPRPSDAAREERVVSAARSAISTTSSRASSATGLVAPPSAGRSRRGGRTCWWR